LKEKGELSDISLYLLDRRPAPEGKKPEATEVRLSGRSQPDTATETNA